jgi:hypothetical protein
MMVELRLTGRLYREIVDDLCRPHPFAAERVGFALARTGSLLAGDKLVLLTKYHPIPDSEYLDDRKVGARIGSESITWAMQAAYFGRQDQEGIFHIHLHPHSGITRMSMVDKRDTPELIKSFQNVSPLAAHGAIIFSHNHGGAWVREPGSRELKAAARLRVVGQPIGFFEGEG